MGKMKIVLGVALSCLFVLTGCGGTLPEMTAEQEDKIVEYAAAAIMRHTNDYDSRLVDLSLYSNPTDGVEETEPEEEQGTMDDVADTETVDIGEEGSMTLDQVLLPEGVQIQFGGYAVLDTYPDGAGDDPYFALDASDGKKLLVLQFVVKNVSGQEADIDIFSQMPKCTLVINGTETVGILSTMLLDDLSTFIGSVMDGGEAELVLLAETSSQSAEEISSLRLTVKTETGNATTTLK